jgi:hypothetical protein
MTATLPTEVGQRFQRRWNNRPFWNGDRPDDCIVTYMVIDVTPRPSADPTHDAVTATILDCQRADGDADYRCFSHQRRSRVMFMRSRS